MKLSDPIVDEVRAAREAIVAACDYDLDKLATVLKEHEMQSGRKVVRLPPKRPTMNPFRTLAIGLTLALSAVSAGAATLTSASAFEKLGSLVGDWEAKSEKGAVVRINYRLVAAESVLVQTYKTPSGRETLTVFHLDGASLIATHYCAQGNQPRLRLDSASTNKALAFLFFDATNLPDSRASHLHRLQVDLLDPDHFAQTETYSPEGKDEIGVLRFARVR